MWMIRSRSWRRVPIDRFRAGVGATWVYDATDEDLKDSTLRPPSTSSRRHITTGRRHGWKGSEDKREKKKNFAKEFLEPAAKGELKHKHSSGIPRTAVRKSKGHSIHGIEEPGSDLNNVVTEEIQYLSPERRDLEDEGDDLMATLEKDVRAAKARGAKAAAGGIGGGRGTGDIAVSSQPDGKFSKGKVSFLNIQRHPLRDPEYWREEDYDIELSDEDRAFISELVEMKAEGSGDAAAAGDGSAVLSDFDFDSIDWDTEDDEDEDDAENTKQETDRSVTVRSVAGEEDDDDDQGYYVKPRDRPAWYNSVSTLEETGETGGDFWQALKKHPTHYAEMRLYNMHPESKRIPQPHYPPNRVHPSEDFVNSFSRFVYVTGLPPVMSEEGMNLRKPSVLGTLQQQEIQKIVTRLFGVVAEQVYPANETSAFIGFDSTQERDSVLKRGPKEKELVKPMTMSNYAPSEGDEMTEFIKNASQGTLAKIDNVPPERYSRTTFARDLFPSNSELSAAYQISAENVVFPSPTTALIRFESAEQAESALGSEFVASRLEKLGKYPVRLFKARRDIVYDRMGGPAKQDEIWKLGPKLIVDGDMPSKHFYLSHAGAILLRGLDRASLSKESLAEFFQPFSRTIRDVKGSIEFVTCEKGLSTDRAYIGFDFLGEAETVMDTFSGRAKIGDSLVKMKLVKDRWRPNTPKRQQRPERSEEEILKNLNDWEQYVDPEDIKYLEENGVPKQVLDESLRGMRFYNRSFGSLDWAMRDEKLEPEKESGDDYRGLVQMYVSTLKECIATPENPGEIFKALHFPGEPLDLSIFEREKKRTEELLKRREGSTSSK